jgi:hypothetical protein
MFNMKKYEAMSDTLASIIKDVIAGDKTITYVHTCYYPKDAQAAGGYEVAIGTRDGNIYTYYSFNGEWTKYDASKGTITFLTEEGKEEL